jgi:cysteine desulfurase
LPNTLNASFRGKTGDEILAAMPNVAASAGSACHAGSMHVSPVLAAMGVRRDVALGAVRFSLGRDTTRDEIDCVVESIVDATKRSAVAT